MLFGLLDIMNMMIVLTWKSSMNFTAWYQYKDMKVYCLTHICVSSIRLFKEYNNNWIFRTTSQHIFTARKRVFICKRTHCCHFYVHFCLVSMTNSWNHRIVLSFKSTTCHFTITYVLRIADVILINQLNPKWRNAKIYET